MVYYLKSCDSTLTESATSNVYQAGGSDDFCLVECIGTQSRVSGHIQRQVSTVVNTWDNQTSFKHL